MVCCILDSLDSDQTTASILALADIRQLIWNKIDSNISCMLLDLQQPFGIKNQNILLMKLEAYGVFFEDSDHN